MIRISQKDNIVYTKDGPIPVFQPSNNLLYSTGWSEGTIQVRSKAHYERESGTSADGRQTMLYNPYLFIGYIFPKEHKASIEDIHVHPSQRNKGIAKSFIDSFLDLCKKYGIKEINGVVYRSAIDFWKHMGFDYLPYEGQGHRINRKLSSRDILNGD